MMKKVKGSVLVLCLLLLLASLVQPVHAKKFDKAEAKKKITIVRITKNFLSIL